MTITLTIHDSWRAHPGPLSRLLAHLAALEAAEVERIRDVLDAPPDPWPTAAEIAEYDAEDDPFARAEAETAAMDALCRRVSGGAPEPYEPTREDLASYHAWSEDLDRQRRAAEIRDWYTRNSFAEWLDREGGPRP